MVSRRGDAYIVTLAISGINRIISWCINIAAVAWLALALHASSGTAVFKVKSKRDKEASA